MPSRLRTGEQCPRPNAAEELALASAASSIRATWYFDVIGSDNGAIYRIHHGQQANVEQLDNAGQPVCAWCFVPVGDLVAGDVMLAQKIALKTNERAAIAVAIRYETLRTRRVTRAGPRLLAS